MNEPVQPAVPSFTGDPVIDGALRSIIMILGGSISTMLVSYLAAHGINNANVSAQIPIIVVTLLSTVVTLGAAIWANNAKRAAVAAVIDNAIAAASTGQVPDGVKAMNITDAQKTAIDVADSTIISTPKQGN